MLMLAAFRGRTEVVHLLLEQGADVGAIDHVSVPRVAAFHSDCAACLVLSCQKPSCGQHCQRRHKPGASDGVDSARRQDRTPGCSAATLTARRCSTTLTPFSGGSVVASL